MLVFFIFFNSLRLLSSAVLLVDLAPGNWIARSYIFEIPWDFGLGGITIYLIGIAQTISQSSSVSGWLPSPLVVDIVGSAALILPFISSLAITITAGALAQVNLPVSEAMIRLTYVAWFLWTALIGSAVFYAGYRLVRILHVHHMKFRNDPHYNAVKAGIYKIQMMVATFVICLYGFATFLLLYAILRDPIMTNTTVNVALSVPWTFLGGVTTLIAQVSVIVSPKVRSNAALRSKTGNSTGGTTTGSTTIPDQNLQGGSTIGAVTTTFQNDNDAILNAIKENDQQWIPHDQARKSKKYEPHFFIKRMSSRRPSNASSQLELTSYGR
ncbi:hypothetical protein BJV82DRAFT_630195 [Fennellomyces sp. T-0311]|nr:hypothetical protein BJV82DRAFT_630195 [Fennellomyces sp. T-0311]